MNILFLGPQGSGKGTQARLLASKFNLFYFESGEFLRNLAVGNETLRVILDKGEFVEPEEFASYVSAFFDEKQIYDQILFDGFPRGVDQYKFFKKWLDEREIKFDLVIVLEVSEKVTIERLRKRGREDDTVDAIKKRLELYRKETLPLIAELGEISKVFYVDGERSIEEIQVDLEEIVNE